jgi:hypothetical protein
LSHAISPFYSDNFEDRVPLFSRLTWTAYSYFKLHIVSGMIGTHHHAQFFWLLLLRWGLTNYFWPAILELQSSQSLPHK